MKKQLVDLNNPVSCLTGVFIEDNTIDISMVGYTFYKFTKNKSITIWFKYKKLLEQTCLMLTKTQENNYLKISFLVHADMKIIEFLKFVEKKRRDKSLFDLDIKIFIDHNRFNSSKSSLNFSHRVHLLGLENHIVFKKLRLKTTLEECQSYIEDPKHDIIELPILFSYENMIVYK